MTSMARMLQSNLRVIYALMMRELMTLYGTSRMGFVWQLLETTFGIAVFWLVRAALGRGHSSYDLPLPIFILAGFGLWSIFQGVSNKVQSAISGNIALLVFPQVQILDIFIARTILVVYTSILSCILLLLAFMAIGYPVHIVAPENILLSILLISIFAFGYGAVFSSLSKYFSVANLFFRVFSRILLFISGIFFTLQDLPPKIADTLAWNPLAVIIDLHRSAYTEMLTVDEGHLKYACWCAVVALTLGLFSERMTRKKVIE